MEPKKIGAAKFKEQCLSILDNLDAEGIVVTKHGKPVARVLPVISTGKQLYGALKGKVEIHGDIMSTGIKWEAEGE